MSTEADENSVRSGFSLVSHFKRHRSPIRGVAFNARRRHFASLDERGVKLWQMPLSSEAEGGVGSGGGGGGSGGGGGGGAASGHTDGMDHVDHVQSPHKHTHSSLIDLNDGGGGAFTFFPFFFSKPPHHQSINHRGLTATRRVRVRVCTSAAVKPAPLSTQATN